MFTGLMLNTWITATIVAVIAGMVGFFAVLRGQTFAAHAIPNGAFAGAAGASLLGINVLWGLAVFAVGGALGIGALGSERQGRRGRNDVVTALGLVLMLGLGALFISVSSEYAEETYALLFGEVFGISQGEVLPILLLGIVSVVAIGVAFRPLMLTSALPEVAEARGVSTRRADLYFLVSVISAIRLLNDTGNDYHYVRTGTAINEEQGMRSGAVMERIVRRTGRGRRRLARVALLAAGAAVTATALSACSVGASGRRVRSGGKIVAVGAENEYADVISQVGGQYVQVSAIMSNPNTDPHTFEASPAIAREISAAQLIVQNGVGYDTFMSTIESAAPGRQQQGHRRPEAARAAGLHR